MYITKAQHAKMLKAQARRRFLRSINTAIGGVLTATLFAFIVMLMLVLA